MIGASGAVAGVLGAYLILFPRSRIASLVPILFIFTLIEVPAFLFLLFWFFSQLFSGWLAMQGGSASGIAWWAHIGGFIFGLIMVSFFTIKQRTIHTTWQYPFGEKQ
jgi:membrane associated rhomboid family serine protease